MIDGTTRHQRILSEGQDPAVAVILLDFVLGFNASTDPVGELLDSILVVEANQKRARGRPNSGRLDLWHRKRSSGYQSTEGNAGGCWCDRVPEQCKAALFCAELLTLLNHRRIGCTNRSKKSFQGNSL